MALFKAPSSSGSSSNVFSSALKNAAASTSSQAEQASQQQPQQQAASAPAASSAPTSDFLSKAKFDNLSAVFPNIDSKTGMPVLNQSALDSVLANYKTRYGGNYIGPQEYRDNYNKFGWNAKSDASSVANGAAALGLERERVGMSGNFNYKTTGNKTATDADFLNAAKKAGVDLTPYYVKASTLYGTMNQSLVLDKAKAYDAIQNASKDLYLVSNTIGGDNHASVLYKPDGKGNLIAQESTSGAPAISYFSATRNDMSGGFWSDFGPMIGLAATAIGIPAIMNAISSAGVLPSTLQAATAAGGVDAAIGAGQALTAGGLAGSPAASAFLSAQQAGTIGNVLGLTADQVMAMPAEELANQIVSAEQLGSQAFPTTVNASTVAGATQPAVAALTPTQQIMQALGIGGNNQSALNNILGYANTAANAGSIANALSGAATGSLVGSGLQALGSYLGGTAQADAAKTAATNQLAMFNTINQQYAPQRGAGYQALNQIRSMLPGVSATYNELGQPSGVQQGTDFLTKQFTPQDLYAGLAPNYQFQLQQGQMANQRAANVAGGALSGNTLAGLERYTQDYAGNAYQQAFQNFQNQRGNIYNTLAGIAGLGQQAIGGSAQAGQAATTAAGQLGVGAAAANAAGMTGAANAVAGGLQNYQLNQILQQVLAQNQNVAQQNQGV